MVKINKICVLRADGTYIFHLKNWDIEQQYLQKEGNQHGIHAQSMLGDLDTISELAVLTHLVDNIIFLSFSYMGK